MELELDTQVSFSYGDPVGTDDISCDGSAGSIMTGLFFNGVLGGGLLTGLGGVPSLLIVCLVALCDLESLLTLPESLLLPDIDTEEDLELGPSFCGSTAVLPVLLSSFTIV